MKIPKILRLSDCNIKLPAGKLSICNAFFQYIDCSGITGNRFSLRVIDVPDIRAFLRLAEELFILITKGKSISLLLQKKIPLPLGLHRKKRLIDGFRKS